MLKNIEKLQKELFRMECKRIDNHREMIRMDLKLRILKANINNNKKQRYGKFSKVASMGK